MKSVAIKLEPQCVMGEGVALNLGPSLKQEIECVKMESSAHEYEDPTTSCAVGEAVKEFEPCILKEEDDMRSEHSSVKPDQGPYPVTFKVMKQEEEYVEQEAESEGGEEEDEWQEEAEVKDEIEVEEHKVDFLNSKVEECRLSGAVFVEIMNITHQPIAGGGGGSEVPCSHDTTPSTQYKCGMCPKSFITNSYLSIHMKKHMVFRLKNSLSNHIKPHIWESFFKCNDCGELFAKESTLAEHINIHRDARPFKCEDCGKFCSERGGVIHHMRIHTGAKNFKTSECGPFQCDECGKCFSQRSSSTSHAKLHSGEKPYECVDCGKSFALSSNLARHMRIHTGDKPFKCHECGKMFTHKRGLSTHMRKHIGEKPFKCTQCGRTFSQKCILLAHVRMHIGERPINIPHDNA